MQVDDGLLRIIESEGCFSIDVKSFMESFLCRSAPLYFF
jgi:hypothetical protein